jgi:hypothetical protein
MPLVKKLIRVGDSTGVILDRAISPAGRHRAGRRGRSDVENNAIVIRPSRYASDDDARAGWRKTKSFRCQLTVDRLKINGLSIMAVNCPDGYRERMERETVAARRSR